jgi:hypothetical protein
MADIFSGNDPIDFDTTGFIPSGGEDTLMFQIISWVIAVAFTASLIVAVYLQCAKPPEDHFVSKALKFLIVALITRLGMSAKLFLSDQHESIIPDFLLIGGHT